MNDAQKIWLKIYLARISSGEGHNDAVMAANNDIDFVVDAIIGIGCRFPDNVLDSQ